MLELDCSPIGLIHEFTSYVYASAGRRLLAESSLSPTEQIDVETRKAWIQNVITLLRSKRRSDFRPALVASRSPGPVSNLAARPGGGGSCDEETGKCYEDRSEERRVGKECRSRW